MPTSKLQRYTSEQLYKRFGKYGLVENTRPYWLVSSKGERLELDFFIDKLSMAVEVQGRQHIEFTPIFHATEYDFAEQLRRDREKKDLCDNANIQLFYIYDKSDVEIALYGIYTQIQRQLDTREDVWIDGDSKTLRAIFQRPQAETIPLSLQRRYEKNLRKFTSVERQEYFDKVVRRLEDSLNATASIVTPSENSKRKTRRKLRLVTFYMNKNCVTVSDEQKDIIARARKRSRETI